MRDCDRCRNAYTCEELTHDNDMTVSTIGTMPRYKRLVYITGGYGLPRIEYEEWNDQYGVWSTKGTFYPLYCPFCGRKIEENEYERTR